MKKIYFAFVRLILSFILGGILSIKDEIDVIMKDLLNACCLLRPTACTTVNNWFTYAWLCRNKSTQRQEKIIVR